MAAIVSEAQQKPWVLELKINNKWHAYGRGASISNCKKQYVMWCKKYKEVEARVIFSGEGNKIIHSLQKPSEQL
jgi:hypothetical protein